jgi:hypothetical protein
MFFNDYFLRILVLCPNSFYLFDHLKLYGCLNKDASLSIKGLCNVCGDECAYSGAVGIPIETMSNRSQGFHEAYRPKCSLYAEEN